MIYNVLLASRRHLLRVRFINIGQTRGSSPGASLTLGILQREGDCYWEHLLINRNIDVKAISSDTSPHTSPRDTKIGSILCALSIFSQFTVHPLFYLSSVWHPKTLRHLKRFFATTRNVFMDFEHSHGVVWCRDYARTHSISKNFGLWQNVRDVLLIPLLS